MRTSRPLVAVLLLLLLASGLSAPAGAAGSTPPDKLDQLVAPIALYPDNLLSQVLMASTYPLEIVQADRWVKANPNMSASAREQGLAKQTWDPSVSSLTAFPSVLSSLSQNLEWTEALGEAFLGSQADVLAAVQRMRKHAQQAGNLQTTAQQTVSQAQGDVVIVPANPQVIYVPTYNPTIIYGAAWAPPTWYYPEVMVAPPGYVAGQVLSFGVGMAVGAAMFGGCNWHGGCCWVNSHWNTWPGYRGNVTVNNINVNRGSVSNWQYNSYHRGNVNFSNTSLQNRYNRSSWGGNPSQSRGYGPTHWNTPSGAGPGTRPTPGQGTRPTPGQGTRPTPGQGTRPTPGQGTRPSPGQGTRPTPGQGTRPNPPAHSAGYPSSFPTHASGSSPGNAFGGSHQGGWANQAGERGASSRGVPSSGFHGWGGSSTRSTPVFQGGGTGRSRSGGFGGRRR